MSGHVWDRGSFEVAVSVTVLGLLAASFAGATISHRWTSDPAMAPPAREPTTVPTLQAEAPGIASGQFTLAVAASSPVGEVGLETTFTASPVGGSPPFNVSWSGPLNDSATGSTWAMDPPAAGNLTVVARAVDATGELAVASYALPVAGPLSIGAAAASTATDLGESLEVTGEILGGVPPFTLAYALAGQPATIVHPPRAGPIDLLVSPSQSGPAYLSMNLSDALGGEARSVAWIATVGGPLVVQWDDPMTSVDAGTSVTLRADASGGTAPLSWSMLIAGEVAPGSASTGTIGSPGLVVWVGSFLARGNATLVLSVTDAQGFTASIRGAVTVVPPTAVSATGSSAEAVVGSTLTVTFSVTGGVPPFTVEARASDGEAADVTLAAGQNFTWAMAPVSPGNLTIVVLATDTTGGNASAIVSAFVAPPARALPEPDPPTTSFDPIPSEAGALGVGASIGLALLLWWRRRSAHRRAPARQPIDLSDLQRMLADGESLERETLYLIGEEQGLARSTIAAQLDEARRTGRVSVERAVTGEEVFHWVAEPAPSERKEGSS